MNIGTLNQMVAEDAAVRRRQTLQPVGGQGDKIFPPTYPGDGRNAQPRHVYERRRAGGQDLWCVLVDSVQSQANRLKECLLEAIRDGVSIPHVVVDFTGTGLEGISGVTSLDAPHRVYDAILRDSLLGEEPFMNSAAGKRLARANAEDASALVEVSRRPRCCSGRGTRLVRAEGLGLCDLWKPPMRPSRSVRSSGRAWLGRSTHRLFDRRFSLPARLMSKRSPIVQR